MSILTNKKKKKARPGSAMVINADTPFVVTEAYKTLRTNILFTTAALAPETPQKRSCDI